MGELQQSTTLPAVRLETPAWVLLRLEAHARGFKSPLGFRRWCRRHSIPILRDGRMLWIRRADIDAALERMQAPPAKTPERAAVNDALHELTGGAF